MLKRFELFKPGTHRAADGTELAYTEQDLAKSAGAYDPTIFQAPIVVGHPKTDDPAYGWVTGLAFAEGKLSAEVDQVDPDFAELVKEGKFKRVSACFYRPDAESNPVPGTWYLKHVGFLGAQAPAVKGLKPVASFAAAARWVDADIVAVEFAAPEGAGTAAFAWNDERMAQILLGIRELLVAEFGEDKVAKYVSRWETTDALIAAAKTPPQNNMPFSEAPEAKAARERLEADRAKLDTDRAALDADRATFAEQRKTQRQAMAAQQVDHLVAAGKVLPAKRAAAVAFMSAAAEREEQVAIAGGEARSFAELAHELLAGGGTQVDFTERAAEDGTRTLDTTNATAISDRALAFQQSERAAGREVSIDIAVRHVMKEGA